MIGKILAIIGGIITFIAGIVNLATQHAMDYFIYGLSFPSGTLLIYLGILGIVAGLMSIIGAIRGDKNFILAGGAIGLLTPTEFSLLSIIGGLLVGEKQKVKSS